MKFLLPLILLLLTATTNIYAGKNDNETKNVVVKDETTGDYSYKDVVKVENVTKEEMYAKAKKFILANFKNGDNNNQFDEANLSIINTSTVLLDGAAGFNWTINNAQVNFKINLEFKDERYRFVINNIIVYVEERGARETLTYGKISPKNKPGKHIITQVNEKLLGVTNQLEKAIKSEKTKDSNW